MIEREGTRMTFFTVVVLLGTFAQSKSVAFFPNEITDAKNARFEAYAPEKGLALLPKDETRPKLWYAPVAAIRDGSETRIWYQRSNTGETEWTDQRTLCLGILEHGEWKLPEIHSEPPVWGGPNNVVMRRSPHKPTWGGFNVFQIIQDGDVLRMLYWDQPSETGQAGAMLATSKDKGVTWEKDTVGAVFTEHNDAFTLLRMDDGYTLFQTMLEDWPDKPFQDNLPKKKRVQSIRYSKDLSTWSPQKVLLRPDEKDPPETEFYLMKSFPYGHGYAGLVMKYFGDPKMPDKHSAILQNELILSHDGKKWQRPFRDTDIGFWCYADPFPLNDRTHFVIWKDNGMETVSYPPSRMFGVVFDGEGEFTSPSIEIDTNRFLLNADTSRGWIEIEMLIASPIEKKRIEGVDATETPLEWLELVADFAPSKRRILAYPLYASGPYLPVSDRTVRFRIRGENACVFGLEMVSPSADFYKDWQKLHKPILDASPEMELIPAPEAVEEKK
jgi:hypothetical protein